MKTFRFSILSFLFCALFSSVSFAADPEVKPFAELDLYAGYDYNKTADARHNAFDTGIIGSTAIGANVTYDKISGKFAVGFSDMSDDLKASAREAFLNFDNGSYSIMVGQNTAPSVVWSNEATFANNSTGFGALDMDYALQAKFTAFGLYLDIIKATFAPAIKEDDTANSITKGTARANLPIAAAGYDFKSESVNFGFGGMGTYFNSNSEANNKRTLSWQSFAHANLIFGDFSLLGSVGYGQNTGNMNFGEAGGISGEQANISQAYAYYDSATGKRYDQKHLEGFLEAGFAAAKNLTLHLGAGYAMTDFDQSGVTNDKAYEAYLNGYYSLNEHITLAPEVAVYRFKKGKTNAEDSDSFFAGMLMTAAL